MDDELVERAVKAAMDIYDGNDEVFVAHLCRTAIEAYEKAIAEAGFVIVSSKPTEAMIMAGSEAAHAVGTVNAILIAGIACAPKSTDRSAPGQPSA